MGYVRMARAVLPAMLSRQKSVIIHCGPEVKTIHVNYLSAIRDYNEKTIQLQTDRVRYETELRQAGEDRLKGLPIREAAPPLAQPDSVKLFVSDPSKPYRVELPEGSFEVAPFQDGKEVAGSRRHLDSVAMAQVSAVTMDIVPEERWTRLLPWPTSAHVIHVRAGTRLCAPLGWSDLFDERTYARLVMLQADVAAGKTVWIKRRPARSIELEAAMEGDAWRPLLLQDHAVRQTGRASLGCRIEPAGAAETADLAAFAIPVPASGSGKTLRLRMIDGSVEPRAVPGTRNVAISQPLPPFRVWGLALQPFVLGIAIRGLRLPGMRRRAVKAG